MSKIKLVRRVIDATITTIDKYAKDQSYNKFFAYFAIRNVQHLLPEIESINALKKMLIAPDEVTEFEKLRDELIEKYADRDSDNKLIFIEQNDVITYTFTNDKVSFDDGMAVLIEKYKEPVEKHEKSIKEFYELMNEEVEIEVAKISFKHVPDNIDMNIINLFLNETPEEVEKLLLG